jgi:hypothetical protein
MDVKGAYLNGILKKDVYMKQPESFEDGTKCVCKLKKTLYSLKQLGREWNKELDRRLKMKGFGNTRSDLCAYVRHQESGNIEIVMVWVDDLMIFVPSGESMTRLQNDLRSVFDLTDLGTPAKIIGIEISQTTDTIILSQLQYIDSILHKHKLQNLNPVSTPLDPNVIITKSGTPGTQSQ